MNEWLRPLEVLRFDAANLYLKARHPMQAAWFEEHIRPRIKKNGFFNENHRSIKIHIDSPSKQIVDSAAIAPMGFRKNPLDPTYTLRNFVTDAGNAMALKLMRELTTNSPSAAAQFNPIFLFGPHGSGKTHLLMGVASELKIKCLYVTAETFTEHVVQAIRSGRMREFRAIYRNLDVLLVDNVDQLAKRAATQEEFFHTFNALHTLGKQIALTSLAPPSKLSGIEPRLVSRFDWGIVAPLEKIGTEKILRQKAAEWDFRLSEQIALFLLERFPREPVMALQMLALRAQKQTDIDVKTAERLLADALRREQAQAITPEVITAAVSRHFGITISDLVGKSQTKEFSFPRQIAMYLCREIVKMPFQAIGHFFGRDHSTAMSSIKQMQRGVQERDPSVVEAVEAASQNIARS